MRERMNRKKWAVLASLMCLMMLFNMSVPVFAEAADQETVSVIIEGVKENFYDGSVEVKQGATVEDVLTAVDKASDDVTINMEPSQYGGNYVTAVNEDKAGAFGGYDGWMFMVNDVVTSDGISTAKTADGDKVTLYYADPYGDEGFQYPKMDDSDAENGKIKFTSTDITYDSDGNASETVNPVADAKVVLTDSDTKEVNTYKTDKDGVITLDLKEVKNGEYTLKISKENKDGKPLVLRSDYKLSITNGVKAEKSTNIAVWICIGVAIAAIIAAIVYSKKKKK